MNSSTRAGWPGTDEMERLVVELSHEHPRLPRIEAERVFGAEVGPPGRYYHEEGVAVFTLPSGVDPADAAGRLASRLSHARGAGPHLFTCRPEMETVLRRCRVTPLPPGTFSVRAVGWGDFSIEREAGRVWAGERRVSLNTPDNEVRLLTGRKVVAYIPRASVGRSAMESRRPMKRPFFSPVSLHPRLARLLVNLTGARRGERLWDPFCGTGGIAIEATLIGLRAAGSDIDGKMVDGARLNHRHCAGDDGEFFHGDVGEAARRVGTVDAVAADLPYGRASSTKKEPLASLYRRAFGAIAGVLKPGGRAAIITPLPVPQPALCRELTIPLRVHRSLTRYISVFTKNR